MEVTSIAAMATTNAMTRTQQELAVAVLKKSMDLHEASAMQLLQAIPAPPAIAGTVGGVIDTWA